MTDAAAEQQETTERRGSAGVYLLLVFLTLVATAALVVANLGDEEPANENTPLQADISDLETGPGSPIPD